jgi:peptide/nickel transport system ATP-binding protein
MVLLEARNLSLKLGETALLKGVDLTLSRGEVLGLVGASGSGKSLTARSILGLPPQGASVSGSVHLRGTELLTLNERALCRIRGQDIGMVFQDSASAFDPLMTVGDHVAEPLRWHFGLGREAARKEARRALKRAEFPADIDAFSRYPHEVSGGQRQRAMIAAAIVLSPKLLLADEPTTALDVTTQASILALVRTLAKEDGMAVLLVSHDLPSVASIADHIALMDEGAIVETSDTVLINEQNTPKLVALFASAKPRLVRPSRTGGEVLLTANRLSYAYRGKRAVDGVSFTLRKGECLGLVGQSGSGKSTLARLAAGLAKPLEGQLVRAAGKARVQMVFQDPVGAFNPRWTLGHSIAEPLPRMSRRELEKQVADALIEVGLEPSFAARYPHELSGGQAQRAAIARAIIAKPDVLVLDEPVSALDVAIRGQILDLLDTLKSRYGLAMLFITHDLGVARSIAHHLIVLQNGVVVEEGPASDVLTTPKHPYTHALVASSPTLRL